MHAQSSSFYAIDQLPDVFADVDPVAIRPDEEGVASIAYSTAFQIAFGYWRALRNECSERVLPLTATCLKINPANYTVWHHRRLCLEVVYRSKEAGTTEKLSSSSSTTGTTSSELNNYVTADLQLAAALGGANPKNYQIWHHRRALLETVLLQYKDNVDQSAPLVTAELDYIASVLREDAKNYHAWTHRQWCIQKLATALPNNTIWDAELQFAAQLIQQDRRNNSAWNHRWFVTHRGRTQTALTAENADTEMNYIVNHPDVALRGDANNESPWRYYVAVIKEQIFALQDGASVIQLLCRAEKDIETVTVRRVSQIATMEHAPNATGALIDVLEWKGDADALQQAMELCHLLANEHDLIRQKYWNFRAQQVQTALDQLEVATK